LHARASATYIPFLFLTILRPHTSTLFPYTTLFRSTRQHGGRTWSRQGQVPETRPEAARNDAVESHAQLRVFVEQPLHVGHLRLRSEEHTSELQSRENLVCRLLLEKKKNKYYFRSTF